MPQVVEHLPRKNQALTLNLSNVPQKMKIFVYVDSTLQVPGVFEREKLELHMKPPLKCYL
jgi:hypothetical protein